MIPLINRRLFFSSRRYFKKPSFYQNEVVERYGNIDTNLVTLVGLKYFGRHLTKAKLLKYANYLRNELSIRLAHRLVKFQQLPFIVGTNPHISNLYNLYWNAFDKFRRVNGITFLS
jgi:pyruvate dehydrogenase kinase 2/3/4